MLNLLKEFMDLINRNIERFEYWGTLTLVYYLFLFTPRFLFFFVTITIYGFVYVHYPQYCSLVLVTLLLTTYGQIQSQFLITSFTARNQNFHFPTKP